MTRERHRSGKFKARRAADAVPLLAGCDELSRAARILSARAKAVAVEGRRSHVSAMWEAMGLAMPESVRAFVDAR